MKMFFVTTLAVVAAGCAPEPPGASAVAVADPGAPVPIVRFAPVLAGTADYRPVQPRPWGEVNDRVAPGGAR